MDLNRLPQLCVHLITDFISDEISTQKKLVAAEYKAKRVKEMYREILEFIENSVYRNSSWTCKIKKEDLATLFQVYKGAEETACVYLQSTRLDFVNELSRHYRNIIDNSNLGTQKHLKIIDKLLARTYREYSAYHQIKPKPKLKSAPKPIKKVKPVIEFVIIGDEENEYMNELMECVICDRKDIPRRLLHWNTSGSYTDRCEECNNK